MANLIIRDDNDLEERYSPTEMTMMVNEYFNSLIKNRIDYNSFIDGDEEYREDYLEKHQGQYPVTPKKPTTSGLAMFLGFASRMDMNKIQVDGAYALIIRRGISMIEEFFEQELYSAHCGGAKFWLKNHGWVEQQPKDFGTDKTINVIMTAERVEDNGEQEEKDRLELIEDLKGAGLDISKRVDVKEGKEVL